MDAIRLLRALVAAGAKPRAPMDSARMDKIAVRDVARSSHLPSHTQKGKAGWSIAREKVGFPSLVRARSSLG